MADSVLTGVLSEKSDSIGRTVALRRGNSALKLLTVDFYRESLLVGKVELLGICFYERCVSGLLFHNAGRSSGLFTHLITALNFLTITKSICY